MDWNVTPQATILVAHSVAMEIGTNNLVIMGAFDGLNSAGFPTQMTFYAVAKVWGLPAGPGSACLLRVVDRGSDEVIAEAGEHRFHTDGPFHVHTAISYFENVQFPRPGVYEVRAYIQDEIAGRYPMVAASPKSH